MVVRAVCMIGVIFIMRRGSFYHSVTVCLSSVMLIAF